MHCPLRPLRAMVIGSVAMLISFGALSGSAFGAVAGHEIVGVPSAINSSNKSVTANCPAGKQVVGAAGNKSFAAGGQALVSRIRPDPGLTSVTVSGAEDGTGFAGTWGLSAYAFCATPLPGLQRVPATSATNSSNKAVTAVCPGSKKLLGTGGEITGGGGQVVLGAIRPRADLSGVVVSGLEDGNGFAGAWSVTAYAVCASPDSGVQRIAATSPSNSANKTIQANCAGGKRPLGTGGEITGGAGQVSMDLSPFTVGDDFVGANARAFEDENGYAANWSVTAYAICAAVSRRVVATSALNSEDKTQFADCPSGMQATGVGGNIIIGGGQVLLDDVAPAPDPPNTAVVVGFEDETGFTGRWRAQALAICATPGPGGVFGLERVEATSNVTSQAVQSITASCSGGKKVVGAGGLISGGFGQVVLDEIIPGSSLTSVTATGYEDPTGYTGSWSVTAYAICGTPLRELQRVLAISPSSTANKGVTATCPTGTNLLGGGADLLFASGRVVLSSMTADSSLTSVNAFGQVGENGISTGWRVAAYAICAHP